MATVGVAGLGAMGSRIARRLADAGHELVVWNRDPAKAEPLVGAGAVAAASPADLAGRVEAVITMVADPRALVDVTEGPDGVVAGMSEGTTLIQMSTVGLESISRLAALLTDDAPIARHAYAAVVPGKSNPTQRNCSRLTARSRQPPALELGFRLGDRHQS